MRTIFALLCLFFAFSMTQTQVYAADGVTRKLVFPSAYPMGALRVEKAIGKDKENVLLSATAQGTVSKEVPTGYMMALEINPHCLEKPQLLLGMPTDGIDMLTISYMSMDEDHICDLALPQIPEFKHPLKLNCKRSDVTDAGIMHFKSLTNLTYLNCFMAAMNGSFLTQSSQLKKLVYLNLGNNAVQEKYLVEMCHLTALQVLNLRHNDLRDKGLLEVCKTKSLKSLNIADNPRLTDIGTTKLSQLENLESLDLARDAGIGDSSIASMNKLTHLKDLDLRGTKITAEGLQGLKLSKLVAIVLPQHFSRPQMATIKQLMPSTKIIFDTGDVDEERRIQFAPLK